VRFDNHVPAAQHGVPIGNGKSAFPARIQQVLLHLHDSGLRPYLGGAEGAQRRGQRIQPGHAPARAMKVPRAQAAADAAHLVQHFQRRLTILLAQRGEQALARHIVVIRRGAPEVGPRAGD